MAGRAARPYSVGQHRAKQQFKVALTTRNNESKLRRLEHVLANNTLECKDSVNKELTRLAAGEVSELKLRLANIDDVFSIKVNEICRVDDKANGRAPKDVEAGNFNWLRQANEEEDRAARRQVSALTEKAMSCRGYILGQAATVPLVQIENMVQGTRFVSPTKGSWPEEITAGDAADTSAVGPASTVELKIAKGVVLQEAVKAAKEGKRVVAVNAASAYHIGGGFKTGGRHALEEAMCVQSTLYASLAQAARLAENVGIVAPDWVRPAQKLSGAEWLQHIPDDGAVLSPFVEVFRAGTNDGYPFEEAAVMLEAVVSVAMPNCNDRMSDSPVDAHPDPQEYRLQLQKKWRAVFTAAARYTQADTLVVPDAGCGVFRNPPDQVGAVFGQVLRDEFVDCFKEVIIAFPGGRNGEVFAEQAAIPFKSESPQAQE